MILKEAFRYQNYLKTLQLEIVRFLNQRDNVITEEEKLMYSSVDKDKEDEVEITSSEYDINKIISLIDDVIAEKESITKAIGKTKAECGYDIDGMLEINKFKTTFIDSLENLNSIKCVQTKSTKTGYKFNINGEQLAYRFPTLLIETINFDRKVTKGMSNTFKKNTDEVSNLIDRLNVTLEVNFEPKFNINDSFDEMLESMKIV